MQAMIHVYRGQRTTFWSVFFLPPLLSSCDRTQIISKLAQPVLLLAQPQSRLIGPLVVFCTLCSPDRCSLSGVFENKHDSQLLGSQSRPLINASLSTLRPWIINKQFLCILKLNSVLVLTLKMNRTRRKAYLQAHCPSVTLEFQNSKCYYIIKYFYRD